MSFKLFKKQKVEIYLLRVKITYALLNKKKNA